MRSKFIYVVVWRVILLAGRSCGILDPLENVIELARQSDKIIDVNIPWLPFENETRCYDELGCLNITRSWYHLIHRPFNVFPLSRDMINTKFFLYTRNNPVEASVIAASCDSIDESDFNGTRATKFIIHGFIDTSLSNWIFEMKTELLKADDVNVIVVDWAGGSLPLYTQATANTRLVGLEVAHLIKFLEKHYGLMPKDVHIIGHSLGAHTAGYAGERVKRVGRITGLDPAEPYFQNMPAHTRLDPSDADFVDVIHTDGKSILFLGYGMSSPCGHIDFYPNNGKEQPGCDITQAPLVPLTLIRDGLEEASRVLVACNHIRAIKLFIDSINSQCPYIGHQCPTYAHFLAGKCFKCSADNCALMGYRADLKKINAKEIMGTKFFLLTGREFPYCRHHYRINVQLARPRYAESWVQGSIKVSMYSDAGIIHDLDLTNGGYAKLEHGTTHSVVVTHPADLAGKMKKVVVSWEYDMNVLEPRSLCLLWCNDHLYVKSIVVDEMEMPGRGKRMADFSSRMCAPGKREYADIPNKGRSSFYDCDYV